MLKMNREYGKRFPIILLTTRRLTGHGEKISLYSVRLLCGLPVKKPLL